uniref:Uncharacterized protein n=1 Tax=Plectus sambesii TaxID=2011161 RepID=A0A914UNK8_9BILA
MLLATSLVSVGLLLSSHITGAVEEGSDLCQCATKQPLDSLCSDTLGFKLSGSCCLNKASRIVGVLLHECSVSQLDRSSRLGSTTFQAVAADLLFLDLSGNTFHDVGTEFFRGMSSLKELYLPTAVFQQCPGGADAWKHQLRENGTLTCSEQVDVCEETAFNCTVSAQCVHCQCANDGPGMVQCPCNDGYHGYKCLKQGTFPFFEFYAILVPVTIVLSAVLWFTQRRNVRPKQHAN